MAAINSADPERVGIDSPTAWFVVLENARLKNDFERAAQAVRQLRRLGVEVRFVRSAEPEGA